MLIPIGENLWGQEQPLRVAGFAVNHRMTVAWLATGDVLVHSPVKSDPELLSALAALGTVKWIMAPSHMHDLYLQEWIDHCPQAALLHSPGMKLPQAVTERLIPLDERSGAWFGGEIDCLLLRGMPRINEVACLHKPSRSLMVADLVFNLSPAAGFQRWMQKANGVYQWVAPSRLFRMFIADPEAFRASLEQILAWDFDRLIPGHGTIIRTGGKARLRVAFAWLWSSRESTG